MRYVLCSGWLDYEIDAFLFFNDICKDGKCVSCFKSHDTIDDTLVIDCKNLNYDISYIQQYNAILFSNGDYAVYDIEGDKMKLYGDVPADGWWAFMNQYDKSLTNSELLTILQDIDGHYKQPKGKPEDQLRLQSGTSDVEPH